MKDITIWAVLVAAMSSVLLGGFWYSKSFLGGLWNREAGRGEEPEQGQHPARVFGVSLDYAALLAEEQVTPIGNSPQAHEDICACGMGLGSQTTEW